MKLTEKCIAAARADKRTDKMIEGRRGLMLRLEPNLKGEVRKSFRVRYKKDKQTRVVTLGEYKKPLTLADVEALHGRVRQALKAGVDPRAIVEAFHRETLLILIRPHNVYENAEKAARRLFVADLLSRSRESGQAVLDLIAYAQSLEVEVGKLKARPKKNGGR